MNTHLLRLVLAPLVAVAVLFFGATARAEQKIAVVDVQRVIAQSEDGLRAQATLKKLFDSRQQELNKKQTDLQKQREDIDKQSKVLSKEALQKRVDEWQKQMVELQTVYLEYNKELEKKERELTDPIAERVMGIIKRLASTDGFDFILNKNQASVAFVRTDLDLTDRCIQMVNGGAAPAPAPQAPAAPAPPKK